MEKSKMASKSTPAPKRRAARGSFDGFWNILTLAALLMTLCLGIAIVSIFVNPNSPFNPFPPPTPLAIIELPTATATPINQLPPTWTLAPSVLAVVITEKPSATAPPIDTPLILPFSTPTLIPTSTFTMTPTKPTGYVAQSGAPFYVYADSKGGDRGCSWLGVAGQVFNVDGAPVQGLTIFLGGELEGKKMHLRTLSGSAILYGPGGYEIKLRDDPIKSKGTLFVQVYDQNGNAVSPEVYFWTYDECEKNLILINFVQK
jgi:hypothetical protein